MYHLGLKVQPTACVLAGWASMPLCFHWLTPQDKTQQIPISCISFFAILAAASAMCLGCRISCKFGNRWNFAHYIHYINTTAREKLPQLWNHTIPTHCFAVVGPQLTGFHRF